MGAAKPKPWAIIALAVAGGALAFDRFVITASADEATISIEASPMPPGSSVEASAGSAPAASTVQRRTLSQLMADYAEADSEPTDSDSMFALPGTLAGTSSQPAERVIESPKAGYRLSSIAERSDRRVAVINGSLVFVGDTVAGARVIAINERSVVLDTDIGPLTLELGGPNLGK